MKGQVLVAAVVLAIALSGCARPAPSDVVEGPRNLGPALKIYVETNGTVDVKVRITIADQAPFDVKVSSATDAARPRLVYNGSVPSGSVIIDADQVGGSGHAGIGFVASPFNAVVLTARLNAGQPAFALRHLDHDP